MACNGKLGRAADGVARGRPQQRAERGVGDLKGFGCADAGGEAVGPVHPAQHGLRRRPVGRAVGPAVRRRRGPERLAQAADDAHRHVGPLFRRRVERADPGRGVVERGAQLGPRPPRRRQRHQRGRGGTRSPPVSRNRPSRRRSRNGAGVVSALPSRAAACARDSARDSDPPGGGLVRRSSRSVASPRALVGGSSSRAGLGCRSWPASQASGSGGTGSAPRRPRPNRARAGAARGSMAAPHGRRPCQAEITYQAVINRPLVWPQSRPAGNSHLQNAGLYRISRNTSPAGGFGRFCGRARGDAAASSPGTRQRVARPFPIVPPARPKEVCRVCHAAR